MPDERSLSGLGRDIDRHETDIREIRREYVPREVHQAALDRITRLEQADTSERTGNRTWLLGLAQTIVGVVLAAAAGYMTARGGGN